MPETTIVLPPAEDVRLLDVNAVARLLSCSTRHIYRLADSGRMPRCKKLGALVRWDRVELEKWLANGCPPAITPSCSGKQGKTGMDNR